LPLLKSSRTSPVCARATGSPPPRTVGCSRSARRPGSSVPADLASSRFRPTRPDLAEDGPGAHLPAPADNTSPLGGGQRNVLLQRPAAVSKAENPSRRRALGPRPETSLPRFRHPPRCASHQQVGAFFTARFLTSLPNCLLQPSGSLASRSITDATAASRQNLDVQGSAGK